MKFTLAFFGFMVYNKSVATANVAQPVAQLIRNQ